MSKIVRRAKITAYLLVTAIVLLHCGRQYSSYEFNSLWIEQTKRYWIGMDYWANRLQDWQLNFGHLECLNGKEDLRTVHLLTHYLSEENGSFSMSIKTGLISNSSKMDENSWTGFLIGAGSIKEDFRKRALVYNASGKYGGIICAVNGKGRIVFFNNNDKRSEINLVEAMEVKRPVLSTKGIEIRLESFTDDSLYEISCSVYDIEKGDLLTRASIMNIQAEQMTGNIAIAANGGANNNGSSYWYKNWKVSGTKIAIAPENKLGPVIGSQYTLSNKTLKLTAQLPPIANTDPKTIALETALSGTENWQQIAEASVIVPGYTATFTITGWDDDRDYDYRLVYALPNIHGTLINTYYTGIIRKNPADKDEIVIAGFSDCKQSLDVFSSEYDFSGNKVWFPHNRLINSVKTYHPDILFFSGNQVTGNSIDLPDLSSELNSELDYLYKWYIWYWAFGELTSKIPTVCIPYTHDVFQQNLWGANGIRGRVRTAETRLPRYYKENEQYWEQDGGGYIMSPAFVKMVEHTQTSHLPHPVDSTTIVYDIGVYYTEMNYGNISFAIVESNKFKSSPAIMIPEARIVNGIPTKNLDVNQYDKPGAKLLGDRQLNFLENWVTDWKDSYMKVVFTQSVPANMSTRKNSSNYRINIPFVSRTSSKHAKNKMIADMESNGWPRSARNKMLNILRKGFAFIIAGDQQLTNVIHHGTTQWDDAGYSFCIPSLTNQNSQIWNPSVSGINRSEGQPSYTGCFYDGFGNMIDVKAVHPNTSDEKSQESENQSGGYAIFRLNKKTQEITMECLPNNCNSPDSEIEQYPGWPVTISLENNYAKTSNLYLPVIRVNGLNSHPVFQIINEKTNEIVYTIRAKTAYYRPKVFQKGLYTIIISEPETRKIQRLEHVKSLHPSRISEEIVVNF